MKTEENKQLVKKLFSEVMNDRKLSLIDQYISPAYVNHGIPNAKTGGAGFREIMQQFLDGFPDMKINIEHVIGEDNMVATRGYWTGTNKGSFMGNPPTNKTIRIDYI